MKRFFAILFIVAAAAACYLPALGNGFVWDDHALILRDPLIRSWRLVPEGFNHFMFIDATPSDFYRPLQRLTYTLEYVAFGFLPLASHLVSILCHAAAAVALFFLAEELLGALGTEQKRARAAAAVASLIWAIHPVHSAAVVYIAGRADSLAALFGFIGLYCVVRSVRAGYTGRWVLFIVAAVAFLLSALSKESGLGFPLLGLGFFVARKNWHHAWKTIAVGAFVAVAYLSLRMGAEHYSPARLTPPPAPLVRPILMARAVAEYAGLIVCPVRLHMDRDVETHPRGFTEESLRAAAWRELQTLVGIVLVVALVVWIWRSRKRNPAAFACLLLALATYLPVSGIVALNATVAEHWIYVPTAFLFLAAAIEVATLNLARSTTRVAAVLLASWCIALGVRTFVRTFDWKDDRTFFTRTIAAGGNSARMLINLGGLELNENRLDDAAAHLRAALQKQPNQPLATINLAAVALKQNDFKLARQLLSRATDMPLVNGQAHELLAVLDYKEKGMVDVMRMRLATRVGPPDWSIEKRYIKVLDDTGAARAAVNELVACLHPQWYRADSWQLLSQLHAKLRHAEQAARALEKAREYDVHLDRYATTH